MKKSLGVVMVLAVTVGLIGCAQKPESASSSEAIKNAESLSTAEAKANYLIKEAKGFINTEKYDEAVKLGTYVSNEYELARAEAQRIVGQAKEELQKLAQAKMEEMKSKLPIGN